MHTKDPTTYSNPFLRSDRYYAAQRDSKWDSSVENYVIRENDSVRVGVLGLGNLGTATAKMLLGTGHRVSAWTRSARCEADRIPGVRYFAGPEELLPFASGLDVVICLLPITSETQGVLNASLFGAMRRGGAVINVGRGGHVVEADLLAALDDGQLDAAVLDVFPVEPLASESPFWQHPKVRVFPHISSWTQRPGAARLIASNFKALDAGEKLGATQYIARERGY